MKNIKRIAVIGLGLIGGSLALSLKSVNKDFIITGYDIKSESMDIAKYRNIIDIIAGSYSEAVSNADLIIIATPISNIVEVARHIKEYLKKGAIVTDVGSAKEKIVSKVCSILPENVYFIGGHPMAGSENEGILSATPDLFRNTFYVLTPTDTTISEPLVTLHSLFTKMGAKVITIDPGKHDENVALISHLPHILSTNLVDMIDDKQKNMKNLFKLCAGGFRDMTRIAAANTKMWLDISFENKDKLIKSIDDYIDYLKRFKSDIKNNKPESVRDHYIKAREARINLAKYIEKDISNLYELRIAIKDRKGVLSEITRAISSYGINIEDISIFHSTEFSGGGILKVLVQGEDSGKIAKDAAEEAGYEASVKKVLGE
ncbi:MAG: prephenate dehydrogenase [Actinomycetota bacterium]|nr:prephenate dehydrogenase [Actinomycetota bacterium]